MRRERRPAARAALVCALGLACGWSDESEAPGAEAEPPVTEQSVPEPPPPPPEPAAQEPAAAPPAEPPAPGPPAVPPAPGLDLDGLRERLRETRALGVLTKLSLKNELDDLVAEVAGFHEKAQGQLATLRERFDLLVMKVMALLQEKAPELADEIGRSREGVWALLADPVEFAKLRP